MNIKLHCTATEAQKCDKLACYVDCIRTKTTLWSQCKQTADSSDVTMFTTENFHNNARITQNVSVLLYILITTVTHGQYLPSDLLSRSLESYLCLFVWGRLELDAADMNSDTVNTCHTQGCHHPNADVSTLFQKGWKILGFRKKVFRFSRLFLGLLGIQAF